MALADARGLGRLGGAGNSPPYAPLRSVDELNAEGVDHLVTDLAHPDRRRLKNLLDLTAAAAREEHG